MNISDSGEFSFMEAVEMVEHCKLNKMILDGSSGNIVPFDDENAAHVAMMKEFDLFLIEACKRYAGFMQKNKK